MIASIRLPARLARHAVFLVLALVAAAAAIVDPQFAAPGNLANVLVRSATLAVLAIGQTVVITCGLIDLSIGQLLALVAVLISDFMQGESIRTGPAVALALAIGAAAGLLNGALNNWLRVHPLILTFGMLSVFQGAIFAYTDQSVGRASEEILWLANGSVLGVPASLLLVLALAVSMHYLLAETRFGLHVRAVGANEEGALRAGVGVRKVRLLVFMISGISAAIAGILLSGRLGTGYPNAGTGFELDAIVAVVLGGTSLAGGQGTIVGTLAAVLALGILSNLLNLLEISAFVQVVIKGLVIVLAILAYQPRSART